MGGCGTLIEMRFMGKIDTHTHPIFDIYYGATRVIARPYIIGYAPLILQGMRGLKRAPPPWKVVVSQYHCYFTPIINIVKILGPKGRVYHGDNIPRTCVLRSPPETYVQYIKASPGSNDTYTLFTHMKPSPEGM